MNKIAIAALMCLAALTAHLSLYAQYQAKPSGGFGTMSDRSLLLPRNDGSAIGEANPDIEGSPYLTENWVVGRITMNNGSIIDSIDLRLNIYKNEMRYREHGVEYTIGAAKSIKEVVMGPRKFIYFPHKEGDAVAHSYFEVLAEGKVELLALYSVTVVQPTYNNPLEYGVKKAQLKQNERFFLKCGNSVVELDRKGKSLFSYIGDKSNLLKEKIKKEDLSYKKKEDLIKIVAYINEMN